MMHDTEPRLLAKARQSKKKDSMYSVQQSVAALMLAVKIFGILSGFGSMLNDLL